MDSEKTLPYDSPSPGPSSLSLRYNPVDDTARQQTSRHGSLSLLLRKWAPIVSYIATSLGFVIAIAFYRDELFTWLDQLASWLRTYKYEAQGGWFSWIDGRWVMGLLIFLTTIPPLPLYSTLIVLSGYAFSWSTGAVISYIAALVGAIFVFIVSRQIPCLYSSIQGFLTSTPHLRKAVRAIEKNSRLLFLIRLAPYPYNVMNCLLAASKVKLGTFVSTTALSLVKVVIHTSLGASIHSFQSYHNDQGLQETEEEKHSRFIANVWTVIGIAMCIGIFAYLSMIARQAVDNEVNEDDTFSDEERVLFLAPDDVDVEAMAESPFSTRISSYPPLHR